MKDTILAFVLCASLATTSMFADGTVTTQNPVAEWKITDVRFSHVQDPDTKVIVITVGYFRSDGSQADSREHLISGEDYYAFLNAQRTSSGPDEATLVLSTGQPDLSAINILRISRWMISSGRLTGVTAVATPSEQ